LTLYQMKQQQIGLQLVRKPVQRVQAAQGLREASTGRVVTLLPGSYTHLVVVPKPQLLAKVWAVAATDADTGAPEVSAPPAQNGPPELAFYRKYTEALLRRYVRLSMQAGRVPSLLGRELFHGHVSHYKMHNFEDVVIFCFDMERCLAKLGPLEKQLIKRIGMQHYAQEEAAAMIGISFRNSIRLYAKALDTLTELLLQSKLLEPLKSSSQKSCQGGNAVDISVTG
jgi:hypothetical protein